MIICYIVPVLETWHVKDVIVIFHFGLFFTLLPTWQPKNKIFKKWKKGLEVSPFYTCASKISIRWCTVPEIWSATYGWKRWHIEVGAPPKNTWRYHYFTQVYQKSQWYHLQFLKYRAWQTKICNFRSFCALLPPKNPKNQNFEKMKKMIEDIILHKY